MRIYFAVRVVLTLVLVSAPLRGQATRPAVVVIGTGGTIGSAGDYWAGRPSRVAVSELLQIPGVDSVATVRSEQLWNLASSSIGPDHWLQLSRHVAALFESSAAPAGVVVTHGTDTMEETAYFLDLTLPADRTVIVTGAMRPSNMAGADGPANLMNAIRAAASSGSRGRGTMVLMNDRLYSARDVTKTNSTRVEAFQAPEHGPVAVVDPEGIFFRAAAPARARPAFSLAGVTTLPKVDIVYAYAGADGVPIDALVTAGARGIVVAGVGRGGMTPAQRDAVGRARAKGVVVVVSTRTGSGRVPDSSNGFIGAGDLSAQKARVLVALALTQTSDVVEITRMFRLQQ